MKAAGNGKKRPRSYRRTGVAGATKAIRKRGIAAIDGRTTPGRSALQWRADLIQDLGGLDNLSAQKRAAVDVLTCRRFVLNFGWGFLFTQGSLVNQRKRSFLPIVRELATIEDSFLRGLKDVGLERIQRKVSLAEMLAEMEERTQQPQAGDDNGEHGAQSGQDGQDGTNGSEDE